MEDNVSFYSINDSLPYQDYHERYPSNEYIPPNIGEFLSFLNTFVYQIDYAALLYKYIDSENDEEYMTNIRNTLQILKLKYLIETGQLDVHNNQSFVRDILYEFFVKHSGLYNQLSKNGLIISKDRNNLVTFKKDPNKVQDEWNKGLMLLDSNLELMSRLSDSGYEVIDNLRYLRLKELITLITTRTFKDPGYLSSLPSGFVESVSNLFSIMNETGLGVSEEMVCDIIASKGRKRVSQVNVKTAQNCDKSLWADVLRKFNKLLPGFRVNDNLSVAFGYLGGRLAGCYVSETKRIVINHNRNIINHNYDTLIKAFCHELGHALFFDSLLLCELNEWYEASIRDSLVHLSRYSEMKNDESVVSGVNENFAEGFAMICIRPEILYEIGRNRYEVLKKIIVRRLPPDIATRWARRLDKRARLGALRNIVKKAFLSRYTSRRESLYNLWSYNSYR